ncbi:MAG: DUF6600 domain-containing protein [Stellaceae bacterium]
MRLFKSVLILGLLAAVPALAQTAAPPARVGRLAVVSGTVAFHPQGETVWSAAEVNYPVAAGTALWTENASRAELRIGPDTIDMAGGTALDIDQLTAQTTHLTLSAGRIYLHVRQLDTGESVAIGTPRGEVSLLAPGSYDITAGSESEAAQVAVFAGRARFVGGGADIAIDQGNAARLAGFNPVTVTFARVAPDGFVAWCRSRDFVEAKLVTPHYLSTGTTGYAELDQYGRWSKITGYGAVWFPNAVPADWAPYRDGHWVWIAPWGWTWIDAEPWGFAPSHYGRWVTIGNAWGWVPGRVVPLPVYVPAMVAFIEGFSHRRRPLIAWFPLAPGEVYWPAYTRDIAYIRALNTPAVRDIDRIALGPRGRLPRQAFATRYANQRFAILVPEHAFAGARNTRRAILTIAPERLVRVPATFVPPRVHPVVAHVLPPPPIRRLAVIPSGRMAPHPVPGAPVQPLPHHLVKAAPQPSTPPTVLRGHPVAEHAKPPAVREAARPVAPFHPMPANAAALPPLPHHPHAVRRDVPEPHRVVKPHRAVRVQPPERRPIAEPHAAFRVAPPERRRIAEPHAAFRVAPPEPHRVAESYRAFRTPPPERREAPRAGDWRRPPQHPVAQRGGPPAGFHRPPEHERPRG